MKLNAYAIVQEKSYTHEVDYSIINGALKVNSEKMYLVADQGCTTQLGSNDEPLYPTTSHCKVFLQKLVATTDVIPGVYEGQKFMALKVIEVEAQDETSVISVKHHYFCALGMKTLNSTVISNNAVVLAQYDIWKDFKSQYTSGLGVVSLVVHTGNPTDVFYYVINITSTSISGSTDHVKNIKNIVIYHGYGSSWSVSSQYLYYIQNDVDLVLRQTNGVSDLNKALDLSVVTNNLVAESYDDISTAVDELEDLTDRVELIEGDVANKFVSR